MHESAKAMYRKRHVRVLDFGIAMHRKANLVKCNVRQAIEGFMTAIIISPVPVTVCYGQMLERHQDPYTCTNARTFY